MSSKPSGRQPRRGESERPAARASNASGAAKPVDASPRSWNVPKWLDPLAIGCAMAIMLTWSWGSWPDPLIDFGRELYTPWQLSQGKVLYRDVASFYGPLSPYVNVVWFKLFGVS